MSLDAALDAVPDRTDSQLGFEGPEGGCHLGKLHVLPPERVGIHGIEIGAQEIGALAQLGSPQARLIPRPQQLAAPMFDRAEHRPALRIAFFAPTEPTRDFACVLDSAAEHTTA